MAAILLTRFKVADYDKWRQTFEGHAELRKRSGCTGTHIFRNTHDTSEVVINLQWDSEENAQKFLASAEARAAMQESGMVGAPDMLFLEDGGRTAS